MSYVYGLGADVPSAAGREALCVTSCRGYFDNAVRRRKCEQACLSASVVGACSRACEPLFDTAGRRGACTSACHYTFQAVAAGVTPPAPPAFSLPPLTESPIIDSDVPGTPIAPKPGMFGLSWTTIGVGLAAVVGVGLLIRSRRAS